MIPVGIYMYSIIRHAAEHYQYSENIGRRVHIVLTDYEIDSETGLSECLYEFRVSTSGGTFLSEDAAEYADAIADAAKITNMFNSMDMQFDYSLDDECLKSSNYRLRWRELEEMLHWADAQEIEAYLKNLYRDVIRMNSENQ